MRLAQKLLKPPYTSILWLQRHMFFFRVWASQPVSPPTLVGATHVCSLISLAHVLSLLRKKKPRKLRPFGTDLPTPETTAGQEASPITWDPWNWTCLSGHHAWGCKHRVALKNFAKEEWFWSARQLLAGPGNSGNVGMEAWTPARKVHMALTQGGLRKT